MVKISQSIALFFFAGLCEIGGGYLVWLWLRRDFSVWTGIAGFLILALYGVVPTMQPEVLGVRETSFGRVYAAYGAVFIVLSMFWSWGIDDRRPDTCDISGTIICLLGAGIIMYWPRGG